MGRRDPANPSADFSPHRLTRCCWQETRQPRDVVNYTNDKLVLRSRRTSLGESSGCAKFVNYLRELNLDRICINKLRERVSIVRFDKDPCVFFVDSSFASSNSAVYRENETQRTISRCWINPLDSSIDWNAGEEMRLRHGEQIKENSNNEATVTRSELFSTRFTDREERGTDPKLRE